VVAILKCVGVEKSLLDSNEEFYAKLGKEWGYGSPSVGGMTGSRDKQGSGGVP
jgi:hypothetical protein